MGRQRIEHLRAERQRRARRIRESQACGRRPAGLRQDSPGVECMGRADRLWRCRRRYPNPRAHPHGPTIGLPVIGMSAGDARIELRDAALFERPTQSSLSRRHCRRRRRVARRSAGAGGRGGARPLPGGPMPRSRRHGRGLRSRRSPQRHPGRHQGVETTARQRGRPRALSPRRTPGGGDQPSQRRLRLRRRRVSRPAGHRHRAGHRRYAARPRRASGAAGDDGGRGSDASSRRRPRRGRARGCPASRREAVELLHRHGGSGQGRRLRARDLDAGGGGPAARRRHRGHAGVRVARAAAGRTARRAIRRLLGGRHPVLPVDRPAALRRGRRHTPHRPRAERSAAQRARTTARRGAWARSGRPAMPRQGPGRSSAVPCRSLAAAPALRIDVVDARDAGLPRAGRVWSTSRC